MGNRNNSFFITENQVRKTEIPHFSKDFSLVEYKVVSINSRKKKIIKLILDNGVYYRVVEKLLYKSPIYLYLGRSEMIANNILLNIGSDKKIEDIIDEITKNNIRVNFKKISEKYYSITLEYISLEIYDLLFEICRKNSEEVSTNFIITVEF